MINHSRALARQLAALVLTAASALPAAAQNPPPAPVQNPQQTPQNPTPTQATTPANPPQTPPLSRPIPARSVGLTPGKVVRWSLKDAILAALQNNVDIEIEKESVKLAQFDLFAVQGVYDPVTRSNVLYNPQNFPNTQRFGGLTQNQSDITRNALTYNFGLEQQIERTGGSYAVNFNNSRLSSNSNVFSTQYSPQLGVSITQPLFKNFRIDSNRRQIRISRRRLDLSDAVFRQRAIEIISQVQRSYWDLALAIRDEEVVRDAVKLAETQLNNNQRQVEVGTLAPIDVTQAAAILETRRQQVFVAMNAVAQAENTIKALTVSGTNDELWETQIVPVEKFEIQPFLLPLEDAIRLAQDNRPEVKQFALQKEINKVDIDFFRNQVKPQIDLVASYGSSGIGGTPAIVTVTDSNGNPVIGPDGTPLQAPFPVNPGFVGGYGTALGSLFRNEFRNWSVGVQFSFPLRNRQAKAYLGRSLEADRQIDLSTRRLLQNIEVEVRNAVQAVETAKLRIEAAKAAREYSQQQLEGEEKKFQAGLSTTFLVLTRQNELVQAQGTESRAYADYNRAVADLQRVVATTLSSNNIEVNSDVPLANGNGTKK